MLSETTVTVRKKGRGQSKGGRNERRVARSLSLLISNGTRDDLLWRTAGSGSRATARRKAGATTETQAGDIGSVHEDSSWLVRDWFIEVKHYHDLQIVRGLLHNSGKLHKFWEKTVKEAQHYGKKPLLLAKQDRLPEFVVVQRGQRLDGSLALPILTVRGWNADVYLFNRIASLKPKPRERVMIAQRVVIAQ